MGSILTVYTTRRPYDQSLPFMRDWKFTYQALAGKFCL